MKISDALTNLKPLDEKLWSEINFWIIRSTDEHDEDLIQGCIQKAIAARWGCYSMTFTRYGDEYHAYLNPITPQGKILPGSSGEGDSHAAALLTAYVVALMKDCRDH